MLLYENFFYLLLVTVSTLISVKTFKGILRMELNVVTDLYLAYDLIDE
jgi:hypothetical protein